MGGGACLLLSTSNTPHLPPPQLATLGWGMEDAVPGLRGRSDLRVHHEYQTLAHEVFDNITVRPAHHCGQGRC